MGASVAPSNPFAVFLQYSVIAVITVSTCCVIAETVPEWKDSYGPFFKACEIFFTFIFTMEILIRVYLASDRCQYFFSLPNLIDVLETLPWYLEQLIGCLFTSMKADEKMKWLSRFWTLRMVRLVRMVRLMRILRL